jgi:peptidoglycan/xylan/chitin deacetylase (PgdA/CDA1 family)
MDPLRWGFSALSPAGAGARLSVLIFHRVLPEPDPIFPDEVDARRFDQVLGWLKSWFQVLPLDQAVQRLKQGSLPARAAAISFDDGYADNHAIALPILQRHGLTATFFITTGFLDGGRMWNDTVIESVRACRLQTLDLLPLGLGTHPVGSVDARRAAIKSIIGAIKYRPVAEREELTRSIATAAQARLPDDLMMSSTQVRGLRHAGMQIGAHTLSHPILARTKIEEAGREMAESRNVLEQLLGERVGLFAYPNGRAATDYLPEHARLVQALGFDAALSTDWGAADAATDVFRLPRFTPWDRDRLRFGLRLMRNLRRPKRSLGRA